MQTSLPIVACLAGALALAACTGREAPPPDNPTDLAAFVGKTSNGDAPAKSTPLDAQPGKPPVIETNADPCTFFSKAEIEAAFGVPFAPPKKGRNEPNCRFYNSSTGSVTITAGVPSTRAQFDSTRMFIGPEVEPVSGIGETAYLWGTKLYVLNNGRLLIIYVSTDPLTPKIRTALTSLGKLGAPRLRA
jgi:hypothetical protein